MSDDRVCLDLFCGLGGFSAAFEDSDDWEVVTVDIKERFDPDIQADVLELRPSNFEREFDIVLAGHPCTYFTTIRNVTAGGDDAWQDGQPATPESRHHVAMLHHTVGLIHGLAPEWWVLENPFGSRVADYLGGPDYRIWQCQYGQQYAKPTWLWGNLPQSFDAKQCSRGNEDCHHEKTQSYKEHGGGSDNRQALLTENDPAERAKVPYELSAAILEAVEQPEPVESLEVWQ